ncbi:hypothetical protein LIER_12801 [Lithospermum erythrorhizon]|uniref:TF-B3 domain-containing protein n=1 Tax=Lithospermum erythrorhizon TaxID=34254 RepID=A0AAV3PTB0_LITER
MPPSMSIFFQIIINSTLQDGKLKIPNKFSNEHGNELSDSVTLAVPVGGCWDVAVKRDGDNTMWLHGGLLKFIEDNSIEIEYFLTFKYKGDSKFVVHIFDLTATEIVYTDKNDSARRNVVYHLDDSETEEYGDDSHTSDSSDDDFDDISNEFSGCSSDFLLHQMSGDPSGSTSKDKHNKGVADKTNKGKTCHLTRSKTQITDVGIHRKGSGSRNATAANKDSGQTNKRGKYPMKYRETTAYDGTNISPRQYCAASRKFHERSGISTEYNSSSCDLLQQMSVDPSEFASQHKHKGIHLKKRGSKASAANKDSGKTNKRPGDNYRSKHRDTRRYDGGDIYPRDYFADARTFQESFQTIMTSSNLKHSNLLIPIKFARMHMPPLTNLVKLLNADNDEWVVSCLRHKSSYVLSSGWQQFVNDNNLMVGDICLFERIRSTEMKLKVKIFRKADGTNTRTYTNTSECAEVRTSEAGNISHRPFFTVTVQFYNLERRLLRVPSRFAVLYLPPSTTYIKLIDAEGIEWPVRLICGERYHFSTGWWCFLQNKNLQVGDVCVFELIQSSGQVKLKVNIYSSEEAAAQHNNEGYQ